LPKSKKKYVFAGLGTMGYPMAGHLSKNESLEVYVYNRTECILDQWLTEYKGSKFNFDDANKRFDGLILCLKDDCSIIDVLINKNLISCLKSNSFIIDHSTTSLELVSSITEDKNIIKKNISFYDSPISGGEAGAIQGSLSVMFGGPEYKILTIESLMQHYSKSIVHVGPNGHGQLTKMVNQLCIGALIQGLSEGIAFGKSSGLNMNKVLDAISNGAAQSWQMDNRFKTMTNQEFNFGFAVDLMIKDLNIALMESAANGLNLDISKKVLKKYQELSNLGDGQLDTSSLIKLIK
jgi:3-hydroxyisobutyrate dehydrogenase|tara:strand:- start:772 stop:1650 length:879 start_codon:yes stop_codon:yes gene_type:complete